LYPGLLGPAFVAFSTASDKRWGEIYERVGYEAKLVLDFHDPVLLLLAVSKQKLPPLFGL